MDIHGMYKKILLYKMGQDLSVIHTLMYDIFVYYIRQAAKKFLFLEARPLIERRGEVKPGH